MSRLIGRLFPYVDDIVMLLTGSRVNAEAAVQAIVSFITLIASILNAKFRLIPDAVTISLFIFVMLYTTIYNIVVYVLKVREDIAHDYSFYVSILLSIILIMSYVPVIVGDTLSKVELIILSAILLLLSFFYQIFFNILIKVAIIEIERSKARYMYPLVLLIYSLMAYGFLIVIYKIILYVSTLI